MLKYLVVGLFLLSSITSANSIEIPTPLSAMIGDVIEMQNGCLTKDAAMKQASFVLENPDKKQHVDFCMATGTIKVIVLEVFSGPISKDNKAQATILHVGTADKIQLFTWDIGEPYDTAI